MDLKDWRFTQDAGKVYIDGKAHWPDLLRLDLDREQLLALAEQCLRSARIDEGIEIPLFGKLERLADE